MQSSSEFYEMLHGTINTKQNKIRTNHKIQMETPRTLNSQSNPVQNSTIEGNWIPDFKVCYRATTTKPAWHSHKNRCVDQWSRKEDPEINIQSWNHLILGKDGKSRHWKRDSSLSCLKETELTGRRLKLCVLPHPVQHRPKWIKHFHVRAEANSCQKAEGSVSRPGHKQWLQRKIHIAKLVIVFIGKWNCMKLKIFYTPWRWPIELKDPWGRG